MRSGERVELYNARAPATLGAATRGGARFARRHASAMTPKPRLLVHTSRQAIRWSDMDMLGHVNNTSYFRYFEQARIEWLHELRGPGAALRGTGPAIVNASCTFLVPLVYPGDIEVRMYLGEPGRSGIGSYCELSMNERKYADGAAKIVWIDLASGCSVPLPDVVTSRMRNEGSS
jgi:acyl-CoA thioester hydrolase